MEAFAYLHSPYVASLKNDIESGIIGDLRFIETAFYTQGYEENFRLHKELGGGMVYDLHENRQIYDVYLPDSAREMVKRILAANPDVGCECLPIEGVYVPQMTQMEREHCNICKVTPVECPVEEIPPNWYKALFAQTADRLHEVIEYADSISGEYPDIDLVVSAPVYYEMLPKNISKGSALKELRKACGMEDFTIVAVGDYNNDIEMLEAADVGICPSNAADDVKRIADIVLDVSCEESAIAAVT